MGPAGGFWLMAGAGDPASPCVALHESDRRTCYADIFR